MSDFDEMALAEARDILPGVAGVQVIGEWRQISNSAVCMLKLRLELLGAEPTAAVPQFTEWEVVVDFNRDLWGKVQLNPALGSASLVNTFNHQQYNGGAHSKLPCRNGHICTTSWLGTVAKNRNAIQPEPAATIERISWHVSRGLEWLHEAATSELVRPGDAFELPDYNVGEKAVSGYLIYQEDEISYAHWEQEPSKSGIALVSAVRGGYVTKQFMRANGIRVIRELKWGRTLAGFSTQQALWIRLGTMPVVNGWQVPTTMQELVDALTAQGESLEELLKPLWKQFQPPQDIVLLIGAPIPKKIGEEPYRYHWQALQLAPPVAIRAGKTRLALLKNHLQTPKTLLRWVKNAENWHPDELQNRGRLSQTLSEARILLIGGGALGSILGELLVRMGVQNMTIVDGQPLEGGNLVRHTLGIGDLFYHKAERLAERLNATNPLANVLGVAQSLPATGVDYETAAANATLIIDATGEDNVLQMMPRPEMNMNALFVSCSLSLFAEQLFFYADRINNFAAADFNAWYAPYRTEQDELARQIELPRGAGCWNPLTPAPLNRIVGLAGAAVELLEQVYGKPVELPNYCVHRWQVPSLELVFEEVTP